MAVDPTLAPMAGATVLRINTTLSNQEYDFRPEILPDVTPGLHRAKALVGQLHGSSALPDVSAAHDPLVVRSRLDEVRPGG